MAQAVFALSDAQYYPAPVAFMLEDLTKCRPASSKWPALRARTWCILGCLFLIVGIFGMLVRARSALVGLAGPSSRGRPERPRHHGLVV